jgi:hypothetical protein
MNIDDQLEALRGTVPEVLIERARRLVRRLRLTWTAVETNANCFGALFLRAEDVGSVRLDANDCYGEDFYDSCGPVYRQLLECERLAALEDIAKAAQEWLDYLGDNTPYRDGVPGELMDALDRLRATEKA